MISSRANAAVKSTVRLRKRREREKRGVFLVEGHRAVSAAVAKGIKLLDVFHTEPALRHREPLLRSISGATVRSVTPEIMAHLTGHDHPPDVLAIAPLRPSSIKAAVKGDLIVILSGVRGPGVAGGILAAAAAADASGVIVLGSTTDPFGPACVRAAAGAHFALAVAPCEDAAAAAAAAGQRTVVVLSEDGSPVCSENMRPPLALVVAEGPLPEAFSTARRVSVPAGSAGVAAGLVARAAIALHEARHP
ncbi:MAG TPA: TrmH family RNA methyltransferase [Actinomycetota bacterium]|nr:TrmH family RNA methyltransferase [Actinomycetota bacterium]